MGKKAADVTPAAALDFLAHALGDIETGALEGLRALASLAEAQAASMAPDLLELYAALSDDGQQAVAAMIRSLAQAEGVAGAGKAKRARSTAGKKGTRTSTTGKAGGKKGRTTKAAAAADGKAKDDKEKEAPTFARRKTATTKTGDLRRSRRSNRTLSILASDDPDVQKHLLPKDN